MSAQKSMVSRSAWLILVTGMLTGMGNGSVFGATLMCLMGRSGFENWGGGSIAAQNNIFTFDGFMNWSMYIFGFAYVVIMIIALNRHDKLETAQA